MGTGKSKSKSPTFQWETRLPEFPIGAVDLKFGIFLVSLKINDGLIFSHAIKKIDAPLHPHPHPPTPTHTHQLSVFFSSTVTLKIRSRPLKYNQFFVISQLYIQEILVRIQPLVHKVLCKYESVTPMQSPTGSTPKTICTSPLAGGTEIQELFPQRFTNLTNK